MRERLLQIHSRRAWLAVGIVALAGGVLIPVLNALPDSSALHFPDYLVPLFGKFLCFGIAALNDSSSKTRSGWPAAIIS